jgi:hypothetical protein
MALCGSGIGNVNKGTNVNDKKIDFNYAEQFQIAFVKAMAATCHFMTQEGPTPDRNSVDFCVVSNRVIPETGMSIDGEIKLQLKTTIVPEFNHDHSLLKYSLSIKNYRDLIGARSVPKYLVVMIIPHKASQWLGEFKNGLFSAGCCYWVNLRQYEPKKDQDTVTISIPTTQILTKDVLIKMLECSEEGKVYE